MCIRDRYYTDDYDGDGVVEYVIHNKMFPGTYTVEAVLLSDDSDNYNYSNYYADGILSSNGNSWSTHDLDLSSFDFTVENTNTIDGEGPALVSLSTRDNTLEPGDVLFIDYVATDASGIYSFFIAFEDGRGNQYFAYDYDDDGVANLEITAEMVSDNYTVRYVDLTDDSYHNNRSESVSYTHLTLPTTTIV